jgi:hypothetical protein
LPGPELSDENFLEQTIEKTTTLTFDRRGLAIGDLLTERGVFLQTLFLALSIDDDAFRRLFLLK